MLDNIQKQVERSVGYVKGGTEALVDAKKLQKNTRKVCANHCPPPPGTVHLPSYHHLPAAPTCTLPAHLPC